MKIAILGCGYVGKALALTLKSLGHSITTTTRSQEKATSLKLISDEVVILQGSDSKALKDLLESHDAVVISVAADSQEAYESTYLGTATTLSQIIDSCPQVKQIVYTGSTSVYGDHQGKAVDEETLPSNGQATSKILISTEEVLLNLSKNDRHVCILRLGEIYGPGREIANRLRHLNGRSLPGNGLSITNLVHVDDIVSAIVFALDQRLQGIFNLCGDIHLKRKDLYEHLCAKENIQTVAWDPSKTSLHSGNKLVSNAKIKSVGFHFSVLEVV